MEEELKNGPFPVCFMYTQKFMLDSKNKWDVSANQAGGDPYVFECAETVIPSDPDTGYKGGHAVELVGWGTAVPLSYAALQLF